MRRPRKTVIRTERLVTAAVSVLAGIGALTAAAALMSALAAYCDFPESVVRGMSGIALAAGCFACAFCTANRRRRNGIAAGLLCGAAVFCGALLISAVTLKIFTMTGMFIKLLIIVTSSALGGYKGVNTRPVFRR